jgi:inorganic pyrophosphatase
MVHPWHDITPTVEDRPLPEYFKAVIEIPKGGNLKFELDKGSGLLKLGFIPQTLAEDDDPMDVLVYCTEEIPPLTLVDARAVGLMSMVDQGEADHKVIAVLAQDPIYNEFKTASNFPTHIFKLLRRFFNDYKSLEGKSVSVDEIMPPEAAHAIIEDSLNRYSTARRMGKIKGLVN